MYDIEATVSETGPTQLKLTADWPIDWLRDLGTRTMEIQRELFHGETREVPSASTERAEIHGKRENWPKLQVGDRVIVKCFFPEKEQTRKIAEKDSEASPATWNGARYPFQHGSMTWDAQEGFPVNCAKPGSGFFSTRHPLGDKKISLQPAVLDFGRAPGTFVLES